MASLCYYHPAASSTGSCIQCGMPVCAACTQQVAGRSVCQKCAPAFKARMEQQAAVAPAAAQGRQAPYAGYAPQSYGGTPSPPAYSRAAVKGERSDMQEALMGIGLGLVIGIIGAIIIEKILFYATSASACFMWGWATGSGGASTGLQVAVGRDWLWLL